MSDFTMEIEEAHRCALKNNLSTYKDPETGFTVFTEIVHLKRGKCCGSKCRHCPYGWENVERRLDKEKEGRPILVKSGDKKSALKALNEIKLRYQKDEEEKKDESNKNSCDPNFNRSSKVSKKREGGRYGGKLTHKNVPYTRTGDSGTSRLFTGERRRKDDKAFEAMGTVDEMCTFTGVAHAELIARQGEEIMKDKNDNNDENKTGMKVIDYGELPEYLLHVMSRLFDIGSHVAKPKKSNIQRNISKRGDSDSDSDVETSSFQPNGIGDGFDVAHIYDLESWIDLMTDALPECTSFVMPTGGRAAAHLHVARTVCRRAERLLVSLVEDGVCDPIAMQYLNRLSDFFFTASRWTNYCEGQEEILYKRHTRGAIQRHQVSVPLRK